MVSNKELRKEVYALYAGVPVEELSAKYYDKINSEITDVPRDILTEIEFNVMMWPTSPLSHKADSANMTLEETSKIEKDALIKLRGYKIKELDKLYEWENELYTQIKNPDYGASLIGIQALKHLQEQAQNFFEETGKERKSQLIQMVQNTIVINEHYKKTPLERLGLNTHMYRTLKKLGVKNAVDIAQYSIEDILRQNQIGEDNVEKLHTTLKKLGLSLK